MVLYDSECLKNIASLTSPLLGITVQLKRSQTQRMPPSITTLSIPLISLKYMTFSHDYSGPVSTVSMSQLLPCERLIHALLQCQIHCSIHLDSVPLSRLTNSLSLALRSSAPLKRYTLHTSSFGPGGKTLISQGTSSCLCPNPTCLRYDINGSVMLYLLITANPRRDITLHVSANNPAMVCLTWIVYT